MTEARFDFRSKLTRTQGTSSIPLLRNTSLLESLPQIFDVEVVLKKVRLGSSQLKRAPTKVLKPCVARSVIALIELGATIRAIVAHTGVAKATVERYRKLFLETGGRIQECKCGRPSGHKGWCTTRFAKSEKRQKMMQYLHSEDFLSTRKK